MDPTLTSTVLVKSFAHLNQAFLLASLEGKLSVHSRPSEKLAPQPQGGHRKSMKLMCKTFDQHCRYQIWLRHTCHDVPNHTFTCSWSVSLPKNVNLLSKSGNICKCPVSWYPMKRQHTSPHSMTQHFHLYPHFVISVLWPMISFIFRKTFITNNSYFDWDIPFIEFPAHSGFVSTNLK